MQQEQQQNQPEVVNRLAELRRQHNNFSRNDQQEEQIASEAPMGSSLVENEEIAPAEHAQDHQNEEVQQNQQIEEVRAMIPQQFDQILGEESDAPVEVVQNQAVERVPKESIVLTQEEINNLDRNYPNGLSYKPAPFVKPEHNEQNLDIANLVVDDESKRERANFFVCAICTMVVKRPLECSGCQTLFCSSCIDPWRQNNGHCPKKCQGNEDVEFRAVHRYVQNDLNALKFKCAHQGCQKVNKYSDAIGHIQTCNKVVVECVQGCGLGVLGEDMAYHCVKQCHFYKKTCDKCGEFSTFPNKPGSNGQIADHDCLQVVKQKLKEERENAAILKEQNEALLKCLQELGINFEEDKEEEKEEEQNPPLTGLRCAEAHELVVHEGAVDSYEGNPRCDLCQTENLHEHPRFYRCEQCSYDCCEACARILCDDSEDE